MDIEKIKTIKTELAVMSSFELDALVEAKTLMNDKYGNKYPQMPPHLSYFLMPFPEHNLNRAKEILNEYISAQFQFDIYLSDLIYEKENKFFYVSVTGETITTHHEYLTKSLNKYRENHIREKDLEKLKSGALDNTSIEYVLKYGYARVFDNFKAHITIGSCEVEGVNHDELAKQLKGILAPVLGKSYKVECMDALFYTSPDKKAQATKEIWGKRFGLKGEQ